MDIYIDMGLLHIEVPDLFFFEPYPLDALIFTSINSTQGLAFFSPTSLPALALFCELNNSHLHRCEALAPVDLICISLMTSGNEHLFEYLMAICNGGYKGLGGVGMKRVDRGRGDCSQRHKILIRHEA